MANTLYDALLKKHENSSKVIFNLADGSTITYGDFLERADKFAGVMVDLGINIGDRVALQVKKSTDAIALYAACIKIGAIMLPLNTAYTPKEVSYFVGDAKPRLVICDEKYQVALQEIARKEEAKLETLNENFTGSLALMADAHDGNVVVVERGPDDLAAFLYTSGTTGRPKGAMLSHDNLLSNALSLVDLWHFSERDVLLHALPIYHTHGLFVALNVTFLAGSSITLLMGLNLDQMLDNMPQATCLMGVPTFYTRLLADDRFTKELAGHMRLFISGSAPLLAETHIQFETRTGHRILERYGMTETNMSISNPYEGERRAGTVGFPLPDVSMRVCNADTGEPLPQGDIGVLEVKGPNVFKGYWQMPEKTAEDFTDDGYFITGDLGLVDKDGYFQIVGRNKDMIISGGFNIYPKEVEQIIDEIEGVLESAVVGVPHPDFGEAVVAIVVPNSRGQISEATIKAGLVSEVAKFKFPKHIDIVDTLPRNTMSKVQKNILRNRYKDLFI